MDIVHRFEISSALLVARLLIKAESFRWRIVTI